MPQNVRVTNIDLLNLCELIKFPKKTLTTKTDIKEQRTQIKKDIPRSNFLNANEKNVTYFNNMWEQIDDNTAQTYTSGFMSGSILKLVHLQYFQILALIQEKTSWQPKLPAGISLDINDPNYFAKDATFTSLDFAFYDTDPKDSTQPIPCALNIYCLKENPDFWYIGLIKNTTAPPNEQQVHLIAPKELTYHEGNDVVDAATAINALMTEIHTDKIKNLLHGIFIPEGKVNVQQLAALQKLIHHQMTPDENAAVDLIAQISALAKQAQTEEVKRQISTLQLSLLEKQHAIIKHKIEQQEEHERITQQQLQQEDLKQQAQKKENRRILIKAIALQIFVLSLLVLIAVLAIIDPVPFMILMAIMAIMSIIPTLYCLYESFSDLKAQETQTSALTPTTSNTLSSMLGGSAPHAEIPPPMPPPQNAAGAIIVKPLEKNEQSDMPAEDFGLAKSTAP